MQLGPKLVRLFIRAFENKIQIETDKHFDQPWKNELGECRECKEVFYMDVSTMEEKQIVFSLV